MKKILNLSITFFVFLITFLAIDSFVLKNHSSPISNSTTVASSLNTTLINTNLTNRNSFFTNITNKALSSSQKTDVNIVDPKSGKDELNKIPVCKKAEEKTIAMEKDATSEIFSFIYQELSKTLQTANPNISLDTEEICATFLTGLNLMEIQKNYPERKFSQQELKESIQQVINDYSINPASTEKIFAAFQSLNQEFSKTTIK